MCAIGRQCWCSKAGFAEPTLRQLLDDPLIRLLMSSDGVDPAELRALFAEIADLRARQARDALTSG